ncbi:MAG: L-asparaginase [Chloroflexi bacterium]|nr:L-asparaginase [Chloroflexota bacterium]
MNSAALVTSNKAREKYGLPPRTNADGSPLRFDSIRAQRLAAPVTVYVEQFSAHPLERDVAELYAPPDGYLDARGVFRHERQGPDDKPVYEVTLLPEDGVYMLPYMARQADGRAWEDDTTDRGSSTWRQPNYPDGARLFEEIDRLGVTDYGINNLLSSEADFDFYRASPSAGYTKGLSAAKRTDVGQGDIPIEQRGVDFFAYRPHHLGTNPYLATLARLTNVVQRAMSSGNYAGGIWLEGSPSVEETTYWLSILIDTSVPIIGNAAQRAHGSVSADGDRNIIDSVNYIVSRIWAGPDGRDEVGGVMIQDEQIFAARDVQKSDARPGGYVATGGHGGIVGSMGDPGPPVLTFKPVTRHTYMSEVNMNRLPDCVKGVNRVGDTIHAVDVQIRDAAGDLVATAIPSVTMLKTARYIGQGLEVDAASAETHGEVDIVARIEKNLREFPLAGFVAEGTSPYGGMTESVTAALTIAARSGMAVVRTGRGNVGGFTPARGRDVTIAGSNLTATKARLLLMACLMRYGAPPPARDPHNPTSDEVAAIQAKIAEYQAVFDTH